MKKSNFDRFFFVSIIIIIFALLLSAFLFNQDIENKAISLPDKPSSKVILDESTNKFYCNYTLYDYFYDDLYFFKPPKQVEYEVNFSFNSSLLLSAIESRKFEFDSNLEFNEILYKSMVYNNQSELYRIILNELRKIKNDYNLNEDQYLELIVKFVQSIPYESISAAPQYPVEMIVRNKGDCDDRSILLIGLLLEEEYDTTLVLIESTITDDKHALVGIKDNSIYNHTTDYVFIETSENGRLIPFCYSYIKEGKFDNSILTYIRFGNFSKRYHSFNQVVYIDEMISKLSKLSINNFNNNENISLIINIFEYMSPERKRTIKLLSGDMDTPHKFLFIYDEFLNCYLFEEHSLHGILN